LRCDSEIDLDNMPRVSGKIHFIRVVDSKGSILVLNDCVQVGEGYIGGFIWVIIDTREQSLVISYDDEEMVVRKIQRFEYGIDEMVYDLDDLIFFIMNNSKGNSWDELFLGTMR